MHFNTETTGKPVFSFLFIALYLLDAAQLLKRCGSGIVHAWCSAMEERCEGAEMRIFWMVLSFCGTAMVKLYHLYNSTTAVPKKQRSVQKTKSNKQNEECWFPCAKMLNNSWMIKKLAIPSARQLTRISFNTNGKRMSNLYIVTSCLDVL